MSIIELDSQQKSEAVEKIKRYMSDQLDTDIGQFDAEFLMDFFAEQIGVYFYNQGLQDANTLLASKMEDMQHLLYELEKPVPR